jgi:hypothetical protein
MWAARSEQLATGRVVRLGLTFDSRPASFADVIRAWQGDAAFRSLFNGLLADTPFAGFRWETPSITAVTVSRPFECVLLDCPGLGRRPDPEAFAGHFSGGDEDVVSFSNLGGDAVLIVPRPVADPSAYGQVAAFVRLAPERQRDALWRSVCRGCTCGSTTAPSITATSRTGSSPTAAPLRPGLRPGPRGARPKT